MLISISKTLYGFADIKKLYQGNVRKMDLPQYPSSLDLSYHVSLALSFSVSLALSFYVFLCYSLLTIHIIYLPFN